MNEKVKLICITPIKNESWILEKFLNATSLWADYIIIADQNSTDNSVEIASKFEKVILVNNNTSYNEFERTKILLNEARKIEGRKIIFALDADEIFSANFSKSPEWNTILNLKTGSLILMDRINLDPEQEFYFGKLKMVFGFVDDGISTMEDTSKAIIHNIRLPWPTNAESYHFKDIKVLHFDYLIPERTISKLIWYQCFEKINFNHDNNYLLNKYKTFDSIDSFLKSVNLFKLKKEWINDYKKVGIDITSLKSPFLWWTDEVLGMINEYGIVRFKNLDINRIDLVFRAKELGFSDLSRFQVRRTFLQKLIKKIKNKIA
jgi:hypothetical protein